LKFAGLAAALAAFASVCILPNQAQPTMKKTGADLLTTNWIGNLVVGKNDTAN
jgi:hypothetical protein